VENERVGSVEATPAPAAGVLGRADRILVVLFEVATAVQCIFLSLSSSWSDLPEILRGSHFALAAVAAAVVARGALRRSIWTPKAAVILAAFLGLPHLAYAGTFLGSFQSYGSSPVTMSYALVGLLGVCQLVPFVLGLRRLGPIGSSIASA
jgi:hypothetical protein